ncbi:hypothetical protein AN639_00870 [Candidatus Epulonipiscium fishelsonii]|uniref:Uncharacterized protein n=1 Tax=Candidatus Epulonipiscium fishelsonii TaxID=77094 RepID=A0ACC8XCE1_9FIRM|nr:hypothetical protein AN396_01330 [Epulopiscium sp. SCG-B11WGA-EpuloA1]ONI41348.1 hypothetical protein AN639_00870 [Epulopiscium sp. SCG-B05WGA-EpuloA1]
MIVVVATNYLIPEKKQEYMDVVKKLVEETRKEKGCISYVFNEDMDDPNKVAFIEKWESKEALDAHFKAPHFVELTPKLSECRTNREINFYKEII